jgi:uncharacterized membrane protein/thiol-disulfide isomerase/thioredoxin
MKTNSFHFKLIVLLISAGLAFICLARNVRAQTPASKPVVHAVLFYTSTCSHCQQLVAEVLPPIQDKYIKQLQIYYCDISKPEGDALFSAAIQQYNIKPIGVPTVIVGNVVLINPANIQQGFPKIIDDGLDRGGLDWPAIPGLSQALATAELMQTPAKPPAEFMPVFPSLIPTPFVSSLTTKQQNSIAIPIILEMERMGNNFARDPQGNTLSVIVLIGMIISVFYGIYAFLKKPGQPHTAQPAWVLPVLCVIGCGVAGYLAYLEITPAHAICGPVGHCQSVQKSDYARLFGILPIGFLGVAGYVAIRLTWLIGCIKRSRWADLAGLALLGMTTSGILFSIYLTFLEPFVIGATCIWCLSSAILMTALAYLSVAPGKLAFINLATKKSSSDPRLSR